MSVGSLAVEIPGRFLRFHYEVKADVCVARAHRNSMDAFRLKQAPMLDALKLRWVFRRESTEVRGRILQQAHLTQAPVGGGDCCEAGWWVKQRLIYWSSDILEYGWAGVWLKTKKRN